MSQVSFERFVKLEEILQEEFHKDKVALSGPIAIGSYFKSPRCTAVAEVTVHIRYLAPIDLERVGVYDAVQNIPERQTSKAQVVGVGSYGRASDAFEPRPLVAGKTLSPGELDELPCPKGKVVQQLLQLGILPIRKCAKAKLVDAS
ncbi:MAG TPA: hypothetical protein VEA99_00630 [Gemmatimonadaceae bacterium]|nr:hypothetical protein [Gemmatimonadaceae bacterium]